MTAQYVATRKPFEEMHAEQMRVLNKLGQILAKL